MSRKPVASDATTTAVALLPEENQAMKDQEKDTTAETTTAQGEQRKPYVAPKLRRLGSVRELTFGSTGAMPDTAVPMTMM